MPVTDPVKTVEDRLWAILLASADFTTLVRVNNRVNVSTPGGKQRNPQPKPPARQVGGDANEVKIDRGRSRFNPFNAAVTFGTFQGTPCARVRQRTQDIIITIATMDLGDIAAGQIQTLVETLVESAGPQLGIPETVSLVQEIAGEHRLVNQRGNEPGAVGGAGARRQVTVTVSYLTRTAA
jgi:hypothetical protein